MWEVQESLLLQCQMSGRKQMEGELQMNVNGLQLRNFVHTKTFSSTEVSYTRSL